ncbi:MAG: hypothetical protein ACSLEM_05200 [Candidatus Malihini olakiniferum]
MPASALTPIVVPVIHDGEQDSAILSAHVAAERLQVVSGVAIH